MNDLIIRPDSAVAPQGQNANGKTGFQPNKPQKAAIVLSLIEPADAAVLLKDFNEETLVSFAKAVSELKPVPPRVVEQVALEFLAELGERTDVRGGVEQVREFLGQFMDSEEIDRIVGELTAQDIRPVWDRLVDAPIASTAAFLALEHPQTVAVVLAKIRADKSAAILEHLEVELARTVVSRMSKAPRPLPGVLKNMEDVIDSDLLSVISRQSTATKPAELIGNLMNNVSSAARDGFLKYLEEEDASFAQDVQREMFTFADIVDRVPPNAIAMVVKDAEEETLMIALRYARDSSNPSFEFIMGNLSKRLSERMEEDIDAMDDVKEKEGEAAQMEITGMIQKKAKLGEIKLNEVEVD